MSKKTKDYAIFKKHDSNRELVHENLNKIKKSILVKNLLEYRPILVDEDFFIIDGQHRLEVAKILGLEIYYDVQKNSNVSDMFLLNANQRRWYPEDYLNFYAKEGNQDYTQLAHFMKKHGLSFPQASKLLYKFSLTGNGSKAREFSSGTFKFPNPSQVFEAEEMLEKLKNIIEYINQKLPGQNYYLKSGKFMLALIDFFLIYPIDYGEFMKKLPLRLELVRPCAKRSQFLQIFKDIYNYRNQNPLTD